jgi:hypothetical protein
MKQKPKWMRMLAVVAALLAIAYTRVSAPVTPDAPAQDGAPSGYSQQQADDGQLHWGNPKTLADHFERHGADFLASDAEDYARQARAFYLNREQHQMKTDADGTVRLYDATTNAFGAYNADGTTKTYFMPDNGQAYFDRQPGE